MNLSDVRTGFAYNHWANERLLAAAGQLSAEELDRDLGGSFRSIEGTLRHLVWGEMGWLLYWRTRAFPNDLSQRDLPDLASIAAAWRKNEGEKNAFLKTLSESSLGEPMPVDADAYVLGELIQNILVHSTHHRGQVVLQLRQLGKSPPETGFRHFLTENRRS